MSNVLLFFFLALAIYLVFILVLMVSGRKSDARAIAGFIPDCIVLFKNLLKDRRIHIRHKVLLIILIGYLAMPIDIIPDFIPVAGQLDDAIIVALVLRIILKKAGKKIIRTNWAGPEKSLDMIFKIARL